MLIWEYVIEEVAMGTQYVDESRDKVYESCTREQKRTQTTIFLNRTECLITLFSIVPS